MLRSHALVFTLSLLLLAACAARGPVADTAAEPATPAVDPSACQKDHEHDDHAHQRKCGHKSVKHDGHDDYRHGDHVDCPHNGHYDVREPASEGQSCSGK